MTTFGGQSILTPDGLLYIPAPVETIPAAIARRTVTINDSPTYTLVVDRAFADPPFDTRHMRKRRKAKPALLKRRSSATAIGSTRSWTGITEWAMIPATPDQRAVFDAERALKRLDRKQNPKLVSLERRLGLSQ